MGLLQSGKCRKGWIWISRSWWNWVFSVHHKFLETGFFCLSAKTNPRIFNPDISVWEILEIYVAVCDCIVILNQLVQVHYYYFHCLLLQAAERPSYKDGESLHHSFSSDLTVLEMRPQPCADWLSSAWSLWHWRPAGWSGVWCQVPGLHPDQIRQEPLNQRPHGPGSGGCGPHQGDSDERPCQKSVL